MKKSIEILLSQIFEIKISKQIIIVDDCSTDGTRNILKKYEDKVNKLIFHDEILESAAIKSAQNL